MIIGIIAVNLPFMVLTLQSVHRGHRPHRRGGGLQPRRRPVARCSAACCWPLALPGILAGTILTFILAMNAYATPVLLGGPQFKMMGPLVYGQFQLNNWPFGARRRLHPDDGDAGADGDGKHSDTAPVPAVTIERDL